jgi:hypothetical protein
VPQYAATGLVAKSPAKPLAGAAGPTGRAFGFNCGRCAACKPYQPGVDGRSCQALVVHSALESMTSQLSVIVYLNSFIAYATERLIYALPAEVNFTATEEYRTADSEWPG